MTDCYWLVMPRNEASHKLGMLLSNNQTVIALAIALPLASDYYMGIMPNYSKKSLARGGADSEHTRDSKGI